MIVYSHSNNITNNDFINNNFRCVRISYDTEKSNNWENNYWNRPKILPKVIIGFFYGHGIFIEFDMHPALKPNCDFGGEV